MAMSYVSWHLLVADEVERTPSDILPRLLLLSPELECRLLHLVGPRERVDPLLLQERVLVVRETSTLCVIS